METIDLIQRAFSGGVLSPRFFGRSDLQVFDLGLAECNNYFIDYRGGMTSRSGLAFCEFVPDATGGLFLHPFQLADNTSYVLVLTHQKMRVMLDSRYVTETAGSISSIVSGTVTTSGFHGLTTGDMVFITGVSGLADRTLFAQVASATTFTLTNIHNAPVVPVDSGAGGEVTTPVEFTTPWAGSELRGLRFSMSDVGEMIFTHKLYPPKKLAVTGITTFEFTDYTFGDRSETPTNLSASASGSGTAELAWTVTAITEKGESLAAPMAYLTGIVDYVSGTAGTVTFTWDPVPGALFYHIYRSLVFPTAGLITGSEEVGFLGKAFGPTFTDKNITVEFTQVPPQGFNPFANGAIEYITVTAPGTGYAIDDTVSVSGGTGFVGQIIVDDSGGVAAVKVINGGEGYTGGTVSFSGGTGATATLTTSPATGNYPVCSARFQQRSVFAATANFPMNLFGSKPGQPRNFDFSIPVVSDDSYTYTLDSSVFLPIRHLVATENGLLCFTRNAVFSLRGVNDNIVTANSARNGKQVVKGVSDLIPLEIENQIVYAEETGAAIHTLNYNLVSSTFETADISIHASHLFDEDNEIVAWAYNETPFRLVWGVQSSGRLVSLTYLEKEQVRAWATHSTQGQFIGCAGVQENFRDVTYFACERYINNKWVTTIERMPVREFTYDEDVLSLDCALEVPRTYPAARLEVTRLSDQVVELTASSSVFLLSDIGSIVRAGGGKLQIVGYTSGKKVRAQVLRPISRVVERLNIPLPFVEGKWTLDPAISTVSGLWHLEGETVTANVDGFSYSGLVVTNGTVYLPSPGSRVQVGLPFFGFGETLPDYVNNNVVEQRKKKVVGIAVRAQNSRGLVVGKKGAKLEPLVEIPSTISGEPPKVREELELLYVASQWSENQQLRWEQTKPLPSTIFGLIRKVSFGDTV